MRCLVAELAEGLVIVGLRLHSSTYTWFEEVFHRSQGRPADARVSMERLRLMMGTELIRLEPPCCSCSFCHECMMTLLVMLQSAGWKSSGSGKVVGLKILMHSMWAKVRLKQRRADGIQPEVSSGKTPEMQCVFEMRGKR